MSVIFKGKAGYSLTNIGKLSFIGFLTSIGFALVATIWAIYLFSFVGSMAIVGFISAGLTLVAFFSYFYSIPLMEKYSKSKIYFYSLILIGITYILFAINTKFYFLIILAVLFIFAEAIQVTSFGIMIKDKSKQINLSRNEGLMFTFLNVAWVIGPLIAGIVSSKYGVNFVFLLSAIFVFLSIILFKIFKVKDSNIKKKSHSKFIGNFKEFFKSKDRKIAYFLHGGVNFWWSLVYLFIPLLIIEKGLGPQWVGYFLFGIALPLILFEYYFAKLAGRIGFKILFKIGFIIPFIFALLSFFVIDIYFIMILMILASIGMAMLEPTMEAYFFDILKKDEACRFYGPYNTSVNLNDLFGKLLASSMLIVLPFKFLFLFYAAFMLVMFVLSFKVRDIVEGKR